MPFSQLTGAGEWGGCWSVCNRDTSLTSFVPMCDRAAGLRPAADAAAFEWFGASMHHPAGRTCQAAESRWP